MFQRRRSRSRPTRRASTRPLRLEPLEGRHLLAVLFRVNAGGPELAGSPVWQADTAAAPSSFNNAASSGNSGTTSTSTAINMSHASIPAGTPMAMFQDDRFDKPGLPNLMWDFPVSPGQYEVRLYFAETWSGAFANGVRLFDVAIEGATMLNDYDIFADVGANAGVMKSFVVTSDANLDVDFGRVLQNPVVRGIEILSLSQASPLNPSATAIDFGSVAVGQTAARQLTLTNGGQSGGASITINPDNASITPSGSPFSFSFAQSAPIVLAPGQSTVVTVNYSPTTASASSADLVIPHSGSNSPLSIDLSGQGVAGSSVAYRVNAGGPAVAGTPGWQVDTETNPSPYSNFVAGGNSKTNTTGSPINMSHPSIPAGTPMSIFQDERFDKPDGAELLWDFPVTPGQYEVRLYFAETWSGAFANGVRVFDVAIEGAVLLDNYDVYADVGGLAGVVKSFVVTSDSNLDIDFLRVVQNPNVKAIEILSTSQNPPAPISFSKSVLGGTTGLDRPTSVQFGPDGRLYVAQQDGLIRAYTVTRNAANDYDVTAQENITLVQQIPNHNDDGALNASINTRLVTGILLTGTALNPVLYVTSSDPRIGGGSSGADLNLDTNSSTLSRLTKSGGTWTKVDLVRGLPRSEENHHANGMQLDAATNTLYIAMGGNTNMGAPSNNFSLLPEYALSAAILKIDLNAIGNTTYDLPTLDDETRAGVNDANDPFGGNDGRNQAKIVPGGPVQVFAPGFRNPYDLLIHSSGRMYTVDNGPNAGWGDVPIGEGPGGTATNGVNEPGVTHGDGLHFITGQGFYGGHPNPTRANTNNKFNTTNPQSPVPVANPIEGDYREPGPEDGSLVVFGESTNGIVEYTTSNFGGAMQGDLIIASFDNTIKRVKLSADGTQVVSSQNLFTSVGFRPLDVTVAASGTFAGSIWVVDVALGTVTVFEPGAGGGGNPNDFDGDGYSNDDEIANGTDPNSPGDVPPDYDADFISDLTDPDDDNDTLADTSDKFAVDAANGTTTPVGTFYGWENEGENLGGILGMGFTGLMTNGTSNYASLFDPSGVTAGGAAGVFTIDTATPGTAKGAANNQQQAFQFGVNVGSQTAPFVAKTSVLGPFNGLAPQAGQEMGLYIGAGDQDNYIQIVLSGDNGGSIKLGKEVGGVFNALASQNLAIPGPGFVELHLTIDPVTDTLQASYSVDGGAFVNLGGAPAVPAAWIAGAMAVGLIATDPSGGGAMPVTWDFLAVESTVVVSGDPQAFLVIEGMGGNLQTSSTFGTGSYRVQNQSTGNVRIQQITIDTRTALLPDLVFDPAGESGNDVFKPFTPDEGAALTGLVGHSHASPHDQGFDILTINFDNFDPGEEFVFSIDIEPTSIRGSDAPGPSYAGKVSGMELTGTTVTIVYSDGTTTVSQTFRTAGNGRMSHTTNDAGLPPAPGLSLLGSLTPPANTSAANHTLRITGPAGATVRAIQVEASLHLAGVPGGGFDIDPFEANKATKIIEKVLTIGGGGFVDVPVVLTKSEPEGGYNYFVAAIQDAAGRTSDNSPKIVLKYNPPGALQTEPAGDFDGDQRVDGADFLVWQRGEAAGEDLVLWQTNFGESIDPLPLSELAASAALMAEPESAAHDAALADDREDSFVRAWSRAGANLDGAWRGAVSSDRLSDAAGREALEARFGAFIANQPRWRIAEALRWDSESQRRADLHIGPDTDDGMVLTDLADELDLAFEKLL